MVVVDYVTHRLTDYETKLRRTVGKTLEANDLALIRGKILDAIAAVYQWLSAECARRKTGSETR